MTITYPKNINLALSDFTLRIVIDYLQKNSNNKNYSYINMKHNTFSFTEQEEINLVDFFDLYNFPKISH